MGDADDGLMQRLLGLFADESREHLDAIATGLIELETVDAPERQHELIETLYREVHSLKGAARSVNLAAVETLCQSVEDEFAALKKGQVEPTQDLLDRLDAAMHEVEAAVRKTWNRTQVPSTSMTASAVSPGTALSADEVAVQEAEQLPKQLAPSAGVHLEKDVPAGSPEVSADAGPARVAGPGGNRARGHDETRLPAAPRRRAVAGQDDVNGARARSGSRGR